MEKSTNNIDRVTNFYDWAKNNNTEILKATIDAETIRQFYNQADNEWGDWHNGLYEGISFLIDSFLEINNQAKEAKSNANRQIKKATNIIDGIGTKSKQQTKLESSINNLDVALQELETIFDKAESDDSITKEQLTKDMTP